MNDPAELGSTGRGRKTPGPKRGHVFGNVEGGEAYVVIIG